MARRSQSFVCQSCGAVSSQWSGRCGSCGEWNTITENAADAGPTSGAGAPSLTRGKAVELELLSDADALEAPRQPTGILELDRVTGGGLVPGSAILIAGEPGIGKSTLLLQVAAAVSGHPAPRVTASKEPAASGEGSVVYFSGEEAVAQIRLRAGRLGLAEAPVQVASQTHLGDILATLRRDRAPGLVIIDSIQTLWSDGLESAPGTVSQVRASAQALIRYAKTSGSTLVLVGHVTKEGQIAGPKVVEHMVDTVLSFEGDRGHPFRILRATKNRFGATDEIGVFEMASHGLREVANPSELFLGERDANSPGAAVFAGIEGTRPILVEFQALVTQSPLATPRRAVVGWDSSRLSMVLAVLEARCGINMAGHDVYMNVAGGLRIMEPAGDLAAAAALVSAFSGAPLPPDRVFFGEISLSGSVRPAAQTTIRLKEAHKLGFKSAVMPEGSERDGKVGKLAAKRIARLRDLVDDLGAGAG